jgi:uncharacterized protein (TIRG00374 family)
MSNESVENKQMKKRQVIIYITSGILSLAFLVYLFLNLDWTTLRLAFSEVRWGWLIVAFLAYFLNILLRALRFKNLLYSRPVKWLDLVPVSALHNMFMYLLPAKTGDITYILLARGRLSIPLTEGTATLFASRFYDFSIIGLILAFILPFSRNRMPEWIFQSALIFCLIVLVGAISIFIFLGYTKPVPSGITSGNRFLIRLFTVWGKFIAGLREIQSNRANLRVAMITLGIWFCLYTDYYFIAQSLGTPITFFHISIISIVMVPLTLLPLQGFANIGTHEIGWASVLVAFGYPYKTALAIAVGTHFVSLVSVLLVGGLSVLLSQTLLLQISKEEVNDHSSTSGN